MFKITDEEYAVLEYIRSRKGTHIDHLNIVFKSSAEPAVKNLEKYALIAPDFPNKDIYHATELGKAYCHESIKISPSYIKQNSDNKQLNDYPANVNTEEKQRFYKSSLFWTIAGVIVAIVGIGVNILLAAVFH